ncbi:MAG TPA: hypothetical protein VK157_01120 [Phycisphaerales bacterium]|nr:hypothetical protein [Phycisphaerales bacterium]
MLKQISHVRHALTITATVFAAGSADAQIFSNGSADPTTPALALVNQTGNNTPAPGASQWSEVAGASAMVGNALAGVACHLDATDTTGGVRLADDFTVPAGQRWTLSSVQLFAYQPGANGSAVSAATLRIWSGQPGTAGSSVVFGDATTNRLTSSTATSAYRVFTTTVGPAIMSPDTSRRIFSVTISADATLEPGTYWLDWQLTASTANAPIFAVPVTVTGVRSLTSWNALQFADGAWRSVLDTGKPEGTTDAPQDIAFVLAGSVGVACDSIDFNRNSVYPEDQDVIDFFNVLAGAPCPYGDPCDIDFNNNTVFPEDQDVIDFFTVLAGGTC